MNISKKRKLRELNDLSPRIFIYGCIRENAYLSLKKFLEKYNPTEKYDGNNKRKIQNCYANILLLSINYSIRECRNNSYKIIIPYFEKMIKYSHINNISKLAEITITFNKMNLLELITKYICFDDLSKPANICRDIDDPKLHSKVEKYIEHSHKYCKHFMHIFDIEILTSFGQTIDVNCRILRKDKKKREKFIKNVEKLFNPIYEEKLKNLSIIDQNRMFNGVYLMHNNNHMSNEEILFGIYFRVQKPEKVIENIPIEIICNLRKSLPLDTRYSKYLPFHTRIIYDLYCYKMENYDLIKDNKFYDYDYLSDQFDIIAKDNDIDMCVVYGNMKILEHTLKNTK
jgi:hypothetical protein